MPDQGTLQDAFIDELRDAYDSEKQLLKALPRLARSATNPDLREAFESHLEETKGQVQRLEKVFGKLGEKVRGKHCDGMEGIIQEGKHVMEEDLTESVLDACLVAAGQRGEHYEMAAYGTLIAWANALGHTNVVPLLLQNLEEEKAADETLSALAEGGINQDAAAPAAEESEEKKAPPRKAPARRSAKRKTAAR